MRDYTRIKNLSFQFKFYGKSQHCFGFGKTMIGLNECSLPFFAAKFGAELEILDLCIAYLSLVMQIHMQLLYTMRIAIIITMFIILFCKVLKGYIHVT